MAKENRELTPEEVVAGEDALMDFQFAVIDALREKNISKAEFAEMLGVTRARVSQMLSSEANPTIKLVGRAIAALGLECKYNRKVDDSFVPPELEETFANFVTDKEFSSWIWKHSTKKTWDNDNVKVTTKSRDSVRYVKAA